MFIYKWIRYSKFDVWDLYYRKMKTIKNGTLFLCSENQENIQSSIILTTYTERHFNSTIKSTENDNLFNALISIYIPNLTRNV